MFPWVFLFTSITLALLPVILNSVSPRKEGSNTYTYSIGFRIFIWIGSIIFCLSVFIFKYFGIDPKLWDWIVMGLLGALAIIGCIYTDKYIVVLGRDDLVYGAFFRRSLPYSLMESAQVVPGNPRALVIRSVNHKVVRISGNLQGFGELAHELSTKLHRHHVSAPRRR